jgi:glycosyltransferase involved in cell wall biosynthesis
MNLHKLIISIVTPSYNQSQFLADTIKSVISQEGDFYIDYIIIDGGSSDGSVEVIKQYDAHLQNGELPINCLGITYRWVSEKDKGQTDALVKGFSLAKGNILAWLNSDDTYLPGALQAAAHVFRAHKNIGLMYGEADYTDAAGTVIGRYRASRFELETLASANIICQPATFFSRAAYDTVGGLDKTLHFVMDYDLWIKIGRHFPCIQSPNLLATYRLHETSKTINSKTLFKNAEESLSVTLTHFGWAPLTRVYTSCNIFCKAGLPGILRQNRFIVATAAIVYTIARSLYLNRGFHRNDLKLLNRENFRKLFKSRLEIMTGI